MKRKKRLFTATVWPKTKHNPVFPFAFFNVDSLKMAGAHRPCHNFYPAASCITLSSLNLQPLTIGIIIFRLRRIFLAQIKQCAPPPVSLLSVFRNIPQIARFSGLKIRYAKQLIVIIAHRSKMTMPAGQTGVQAPTFSIWRASSYPCWALVSPSTTRSSIRCAMAFPPPYTAASDRNTRRPCRFLRSFRGI